MSLKPRALLYANDLAAVERQIAEALPDIVGGLIARAKEGDMKAALYLCDRILGRVVGSEVAPVHDKSRPFTLEDHERLEEERREKDDLISKFFPSGARKGM